MGRFASPSALAIGSVLPDLWYFAPFADRADTHSFAGLFWFCLPVGLAVYALFHLLLKQPLIALLTPRLAGFTRPGLPAVPWYAVPASLLVGALTHTTWDTLTHLDGRQWLQHASTLAGSAILACWIWRKLRRAPVPARAPRLSRPARALVLAGLLAAALLAALWSADGGIALERSALRYLLRTAGIGALEGLSVGLLVYCALFQRKIL